MSSILHDSSNAQRFRVAGMVAALILLAAGIILPFANRQLPTLQAFIPLFAATVILVEGLTFFLLTVQFRATRQAYLGGLAGAYGFVLVLAALQLLIFPGVFSTTGLLGAGPQSAIWIWVSWHGGFPFMVLLALTARTRTAQKAIGNALPQAGLMLLLGGPLLAALLGYLAIRHGNALPVLIDHGSYAPLQQGPVSRIVLGMIVLAAIACWRITKWRDLLSLWVGVALFASLGDSTLVLLAGKRFSLGWYGGRMLSIVSSSVLLCTLLAEFVWAYEGLLNANNALKRRVMQDGLTGAFNRIYLAEQFPRELRRAVREQAAMSVVMIDIDHFKQLNDSLGHAVGDECLIAVTGALRETLRRPGDFLARYGGEEFVAVLPRTPEAGAIAIAETMRRSVMELALSGDAAGRVVTVSLGVASIDPAIAEIGLQDLVQRADAALYAAKHEGRNTVMVWRAKAGSPALALTG